MDKTLAIILVASVAGIGWQSNTITNILRDIHKELKELNARLKSSGS